jgi:hypothetical protein
LQRQGEKGWESGAVEVFLKTAGMAVVEKAVPFASAIGSK